MKKGTHIQTDFIRFMIEKYSTPPKLLRDDEIDKDPEIEDNEEDEDLEDEGPEEPIQDEEDEIIEKLINDYKKVKKQYENRRIPNNRRKK